MMDINFNFDKIILIGTLPPPIGGDAIWAENFYTFCKHSGINIDVVDTSLIGQRANNVTSKKNIFCELKRTFKIRKSLAQSIKNCLDKSLKCIVHMNVNCSKFGTIRDFFNARYLLKKKIPFVVHCHCNISDQIGSSKISLFFLKKIFHYSNSIFVLNISSKRFVDLYFPNKAKIVPNFIKDSDISEHKIINKDIRNVLFLGHIKKAKGIIELIEAFKLLPNIKLTIAGIDTGEIPNFSSLLTPNIHYMGEITHNDVKKLFVENDVFVFPSYTEGFSLSLLEAMANGMPVIATKVGSNEEMLENNGGVLINTKSSFEIIKAIEYCSEEKRKKYSIFNILKVKTQYSEKIVIKLIFNEYKKIFESLKW